MILSYRVPMVGICGLHPVFLLNDTPDACFLHQPSHSRAGDPNALFLQFHRHAGATVAAFTLLIDFINMKEQFLLLSFS